MSPTLLTREITVIKDRDRDDLSRRLAKCADFKRRLKKLHLTAVAFAKLIGVSVETVYVWRSHSRRCVPPHPMALRLLSLIERDWSIVGLLDEIASEESSHG